MHKISSFQIWCLTGLKIVGTWACLPWCSISSSFQNSLKMFGHRGYEFLEFGCWNLFPFLPDIGSQLLWSSLTYFSFNDAPNVLYRWNIWCEVKWSDIQPSMVTHTRNLCSAFNPSKCTHTAVNTHREHTPGAVGSHLCCGARGAVGGSVPCSRAPQSWYWGWRECWTAGRPI